MTNKKLKLYLDDVRTPTDPEWIVARNYDEFVNIVLKIGIDSFEVISLDHDLGDTAMKEYFNNVAPNYQLNYENITEKTGLDCAKWLIEHFLTTNNETNNFNFPLIYTHSANPIGSANIMGYVNNFLKNMRKNESCIRVKIQHTINH